MRVINGHQLAKLLGGSARPDGGHAHQAAYAHLAAAIQMLLLDGRLALEVRLPSERELAAALGVSRTTVTAAYDALRRDGYATSRRGAGTWTTLPDKRQAETVTAFAPSTSSTHIDLAPAAPEAPGPELRMAYEHALTSLPRYLSGHGYHLLGLPSLREAIATRYTARGLPTTPEQIMVSAGAQHGLTLVLTLLARAGDRVLVDHPTYPNALDALRRGHVEPIPVTLAHDGWDVDAVEAAIRQTAPRLAYLIPDFQNPTGLLASSSQRHALAEALSRGHTTPIVDETNVDLGFVDPPPPFATYTPDSITVGSASKPFWGGMRIGWIRAPQSVIKRLATLRASVDLASPFMEQEAAGYLIRHADDILPARRRELRRRRDLLIGLLTRHLPSWRTRTPDGGLSLWCDMRAHVSTQLTYTAEKYGLRLAAGPRFGVDGAFERRLRLPFTLPDDVLAQAVELLAAAFADVTAGEVSAPDRELQALFA